MIRVRIERPPNRDDVSIWITQRRGEDYVAIFDAKTDIFTKFPTDSPIPGDVGPSLILSEEMFKALVEAVSPPPADLECLRVHLQDAKSVRDRLLRIIEVSHGVISRPSGSLAHESYSGS